MSKTAVITGATSGIGAAYAKRLAKDGYNLIITGRKQKIIEELTESLKKDHGVDINVIIAELSDDTEYQKLADVVRPRDDIEMLINNAGYSGYAEHFENVDISEHEKMIKVLQVVPMRLVSLVVPGMIERGKGDIINVSSMSAFMYYPTGSVYCGAKAFVKLFSQCLYLELRDKGIRVQVLCPGKTDTNFAKEYYPEELYNQLTKTGVMSPEQVVDYSLTCLKKNKLICIPGLSNRMVVKLFSSLPTNIYASGVARAMPWK
jgi:short-subunit dehydrogenase